MKKLDWIKEVWRRFPLAMVMIIVGAFFAYESILGGKHNARLALYGLCAAQLCTYASLILGLVREKFSLSKRNYKLGNIFIGVLFAILMVVFSNSGAMDLRFSLNFQFYLASALMLFIYTLGWQQPKGGSLPRLIYALIAALLLSLICSGSCALVVLAFEKLFNFNVLPKVYLSTLTVIPQLLGMLCFVAFATRREEPTVPRIMRIIMVYVALPIYLILLGLLVTYLLKCIAARALPNGQIGWLVTAASAIWMFYYLLFSDIEDKLVKIFRRWTGAIILPLLMLQAIAFNIRITEYGLTIARYAGILYMIFGVAFAIVTLIGERTASKRWWVVTVVAVLVIVLSPLNIIDVAVKAQCKRYNDFTQRLAQGEKFDTKTQYKIMGAWDALETYSKHYCPSNSLPNITDWSSANFKKVWHFDYLPQWNRTKKAQDNHYISFKMPNNKIFDCMDFNNMLFCNIVLKDKSIRILRPKIEGKYSDTLHYDITSSLDEIIKKSDKKEPIVIDLPDGMRAVINHLWLCYKDGEPKEVTTLRGDCWLLVK